MNKIRKKFFVPLTIDSISSFVKYANVLSGSPQVLTSTSSKNSNFIEALSSLGTILLKIFFRY